MFIYTLDLKFFRMDNLVYLLMVYYCTVRVIGEECTFWDSAVSAEDMEEMWKHPDVLKEWAKSGERRGRVRFSHDSEKRPYLSRVEVKVRLIQKHFLDCFHAVVGIFELLHFCMQI